MEIHFLAVNKLIEPDYNPKSLSDDEYIEIRDSLLRFGFVDPVIVNTHPGRKNIIVGGSQRRKIVEREWNDSGAKFKKVDYSGKVPKIPCIKVSLTLEAERELNVRLNKNKGSWDFQKLQDYFTEDELVSWGFSEGELKDHFDDIDIDPFDDEGILPEQKYGVIVHCKDEADQEKVFSTLTGQGYECKIVVV